MMMTLATPLPPEVVVAVVEAYGEEGEAGAMAEPAAGWPPAAGEAEAAMGVPHAVQNRMDGSRLAPQEVQKAIASPRRKNFVYEAEYTRWAAGE